MQKKNFLFKAKDDVFHKKENSYEKDFEEWD